MTTNTKPPDDTAREYQGYDEDSCRYFVDIARDDSRNAQRYLREIRELDT